MLYVALFLHDIAKGRPEDHSVAGARIARKLCPRLGLSEAETDTVAWLVEHHLADVDDRRRARDLSDRKTIETFAGVVQTLERLKMLLVLTVCDIKAVGPGVWNGWKGQLLRTLYWETEIVLAGGHSASRPRASASPRAQEELRRALARLVGRGGRRLSRPALPGLLAEGRPAAQGQARALHARRPRRSSTPSRPRSPPTVSAASPS